MKELCLQKKCSSVGTFMMLPEGGQNTLVIKTWLKAGKMPCKHKGGGERKEGGRENWGGGRGRDEREEREEGRGEERETGREREGGETTD